MGNVQQTHSGSCCIIAKTALMRGGLHENTHDLDDVDDFCSLDVLRVFEPRLLSPSLSFHQYPRPRTAYLWNIFPQQTSCTHLGIAMIDLLLEQNALASGYFVASTDASRRTTTGSFVMC